MAVCQKTGFQLILIITKYFRLAKHVRLKLKDFTPKVYRIKNMVYAILTCPLTLSVSYHDSIGEVCIVAMDYR